MNKTLFSYIRKAFGLVSKIAPKTTGRLAFKLFCTTFKVQTKSENAQRRLKIAEALFSMAVVHNIPYSGGTIAAFEFNPTSGAFNDAPNKTKPKTVWLVHGWQSNSLLMSHFIQPILDAGFRVVSVDLPGHGQSSGRTFNLALGVYAMHAVRDVSGNPDMILTHSLGGSVVASTIAGTLEDKLRDESIAPTPWSVSKLVLICSPNAMRNVFDNFATMLNLPEKSIQTLYKRVEAVSGKSIDAFVTAEQLRSMDNEVLLIHAPDDREVLYSTSESIAELNPRAQLQPMPGLGHRRIITSDAVVSLAVDFFRD